MAQTNNNGHKSKNANADPIIAMNDNTANNNNDKDNQSVLFVE